MASDISPFEVSFEVTTFLSIECQRPISCQGLTKDVSFKYPVKCLDVCVKTRYIFLIITSGCLMSVSMTTRRYFLFAVGPKCSVASFYHGNVGGCRWYDDLSVLTL